MKYLFVVLFVSVKCFAAAPIEPEVPHEHPTSILINGHFVEFDNGDPKTFGRWSEEDIDVLSGLVKEALADKASAADLSSYNRAIHVQITRSLEFERTITNHRGYTQAPALTEYQLYISVIASTDQVRAFLREQFENLPEPSPVTRESVRDGWCRRLLSKALAKLSSGEE